MEKKIVDKINKITDEVTDDLADRIKGVQRQLESNSPKKQLNCFIIMPFTYVKYENKEGEQETLVESELDNIYENLFEKAVNSYQSDKYEFVNVHRSNAKSGNFVKKIVSNLQDYDIVLADLTGFNPNVFYELGIRHTLKNGTIMITQNKKYIPSDLANYIAFEYQFHKDSTEFNSYYPTFEKELHLRIDSKLEELEESDNPVRDFLGDKIIFRNEVRIKEIETNVELMEYLMYCYRGNLRSLISNLNDWANGKSVHTYDISASYFAKTFLNRLVSQRGNIKAISFLDDYCMALEIVQSNMRALKKTVLKNKNYDIANKLVLAFKDYKGGKHHILDLMEFYKYDENVNFNELIKNEEPLVKSFDYFINKWKKELEELTK